MSDSSASPALSSVDGDYTFQSGGLTLKLFVHDSRVRKFPNRIGEFFPNVKIFGIVNSGLEIVKRENFDRMDTIKILDLRHNKISLLSDDVFHDLVNLWQINLSGNLISSLPTFTTMPYLAKFIANDNLIELIDINAFRNNSRLEEIHLWRNKIHTIYLNIVRFTRMKTLDVRENHCIDKIIYWPTLYSPSVVASLQAEINELCGFRIRGARSN